MQYPNKLLAKIVRRLRTIGTDTQLVEVKEAAWKLPESIGETLSAFMNHTGGILILGLSERRGFTPCKSSKDHSKPRNEADTSLKSPV